MILKYLSMLLLHLNFLQNLLLFVSSISVGRGKLQLWCVTTSVVCTHSDSAQFIYWLTSSFTPSLDSRAFILTVTQRCITSRLPSTSLHTPVSILLQWRYQTETSNGHSLPVRHVERRAQSLSLSVDYRFRKTRTSANCRPPAGCRLRTAVIATYCESVEPLRLPTTTRRCVTGSMWSRSRTRLSEQRQSHKFCFAK